MALGPAACDAQVSLLRNRGRGGAREAVLPWWWAPWWCLWQSLSLVPMLYHRAFEEKLLALRRLEISTERRTPIPKLPVRMTNAIWFTLPGLEVVQSFFPVHLWPLLYLQTPSNSGYHGQSSAIMQRLWCLCRDEVAMDYHQTVVHSRIKGTGPTPI